VTSPNQLLVGVFVGGGGTRLGGVAKGLLAAPDAPAGSQLTLLERCLREVAAAVPQASTLLVGNADAYRHLNVAAIADSPGGIGPLGGLNAFLDHASRVGAREVLAVSCDLPFVTSRLIARLAAEMPDSSGLVAIQDGIRNPLFARYAVAPGLVATRAALALGKRSLQAVLDQLGSGVAELSLSPEELQSLRDWDTPEDMRND
jgi:molybdopterin-guanine dinucleotide biosynthesis protein A